VGEITDALRRAREEAKRPVEADALDPPVEAAIAPPVIPVTPAATIPDETRGRLARRATDIHISHSKEGPWVARAVVADDHGPYSGHYRQFALRLLGELKQRDSHVVLVASAVAQDGKTTTACNLALAFASMAAGRRVAIVELDLRRPTLGPALDIPLPEIGIERVLLGEAPLASACLHSDDGVDIFPVVTRCENVHEILARPALGELMRNLAQSYEVVVLDTPPVLAVPDVSLILPHVKACITVARAGATPLSAFRAMLELIPREKIAGAFINGVTRGRDYQQYGYYSSSGNAGKTGE